MEALLKKRKMKESAPGKEQEELFYTDRQDDLAGAAGKLLQWIKLLFKRKFWTQAEKFVFWLSYLLLGQVTVLPLKC